MRHCPNPQCPYRVRHHKPAEYGDHAQSCSDCETALSDGAGGAHEASLPVGFGSGTASASHSHDIKPWLLTLGAPAALLVLLFAPVLGFDSMTFGEFAEGHVGELPFSRVFSFLGVGISSFITAFLVVEVVALASPSLRHLRVDATGRSHLTRYSLILGGIFTGGRAIILATTLSNIAGWAPVFPALASLLLGSTLCLAVVFVVTRYGRANGFSVFLLVMLLPDLLIRAQDAVTKLQLGVVSLMNVLLAAAAVGVVCLLTYRIFDDRPLWSRLNRHPAKEADSWVQMPVVGLASFSLASVLLSPFSTLLYAVSTFSESPVFSQWVSSDIYPIVFIVLTLVLWLPLAKAFFPAVKVLAAARRLQPGAPSDDGSDAGALHALHSTLRSRRIKEGALLVVVLWMGRSSVLEPFSLSPFDLVAVVAVVAIIRDLREEWYARTAFGDLVFVDTVARTWEASMLKEACDRESSISVVVIRGFWHRSLFHFLAPHLPLDVYAVPVEVERVKNRLEIIRAVSAGEEVSGGPATSSSIPIAAESNVDAADGSTTT